MPLGAFASAVFDVHEIECPPHSMLLLYTDGVIEISRHVLAGEKQLERVLATNAVLHASNPAEFVERAIENQAPRDDIAVLAVNFAAPRMRWNGNAVRHAPGSLSVTLEPRGEQPCFT